MEEKKKEHPLSQFRFCPKCGSPRFVERNEKSKGCEDCGFVYYFNPSAATVAFIVRRDEGGGRKDEGGGDFSLLVVRRAKEPAKGTLDLPGGFSDLWETSEEGVRREVMEETGLRVRKERFLFSIPNRYVYSGFTVHTMDMFYLCEVEEETGMRAMDDAADAMWMRVQDIYPEDFGLESIRKGIENFLANFPIYIRYK